MIPTRATLIERLKNWQDQRPIKFPATVEADPQFLANRGILFEPPPVIDRKKGLEKPLEAPPRMGRPTSNFERLPASQVR